MATAIEHIESIIYTLNRLKNSRHRDKIEELFREQLERIDAEIGDIDDYLEETRYDD